MLLDTHIPLGDLCSSSDEMRAAMIEIARHKTEGREAAINWSDHLRFLAADTTSRPVEPQEPGSDDCACVAYPSISLHKDEKKLMVTDSVDLAECVHYLAVSYCCSSSATAEYHGLPYSVRRKGIIGVPACPSDLLRRVINFANECRLDYLWIDQECIEQHDPDDKDTGMQAMDLVYQMADQSVAVLEVQIHEQRHLDALGLLQDCDVEEGLARADFLKNVTEALEIILSDPWFERTWCLQESTSAARSMALLIRRNPSLHLPDSLRGRTQTLTEFELDLSALQEQIPGWFTHQVDLVGDTGDHVLHARGSALIAAWASLLVPDVSPNNVNSGDHGGRPICDGAEALWYMSRRANSITSDRLAMFANLCAYNIRLDNRTLDELGYGFSICAIVLAVLNGDFSLMAGVATYNAGLAGKINMLLSDSGESAGQGRAGFSWNIPAKLSVEQVLYWDKRDDSLRHMYETSLSDKGLVVGGCLWHIDRVIDLSQVRDSFLQQEHQTNITIFLEDALPGRRAPFEEAWARLLLSLLCHLYKSGYRSLTKRMWGHLRLKSASKSDPEIEAWSNAQFEDIVDLESATVKWPSPCPGHHSSYQAPVDPFCFLSSPFVHYLLSSILLRGGLPVGRLQDSESESSLYDAIFENASLGEIYLAPATSMGFSSPSRNYSWYPISWRVSQDVNAAVDEDMPTYRCHGLVCGYWTAQADDVKEVLLI